MSADVPPPIHPAHDPDLGMLVAELEFRVIALETKRDKDDLRWDELRKSLTKLQSSVDQMIGAETARQEARQDAHTEKQNAVSSMQFVVGIVLTTGVSLTAILITLARTS